MFSVYKKIASRRPIIATKVVAELADLLGLSFDDRWAVVDHVDMAIQSRHTPPSALADLVKAIVAHRPDAEPLAWALADMLIAMNLKWSFTVPLLIGERYGSAYVNAPSLSDRAPPTVSRPLQFLLSIKKR